MTAIKSSTLWFMVVRVLRVLVVRDFSDLFYCVYYGELVMPDMRFVGCIKGMAKKRKLWALTNFQKCIQDMQLQICVKTTILVLISES